MIIKIAINCDFGKTRRLAEARKKRWQKKDDA
jgi:hypothetical protein